MTKTVRIDGNLHSTLRAMAAQEHRSIGEVIAEAVKLYQREQFWAGLREDYARLQADPVAWADYQAELAFWDRTAGDGLENEPPYYSADEEEEIRAGVQPSPRSLRDRPFPLESGEIGD